MDEQTKTANWKVLERGQRFNSVEQALNWFRDNGGIVAGKQIAHPHPGLKVLGCIDYLVKQGFVYVKPQIN